MSDIYSDSVYVQIKSPCKKRFPSPLISACQVSAAGRSVSRRRQRRAADDAFAAAAAGPAAVAAGAAV